MSDIPTVDSSTSSSHPDGENGFKIEYSSNHVAQTNILDINNETYIFTRNEENQANMTRTLENFNLEETYDIHPLNDEIEYDESDTASQDEQSDSTPIQTKSDELIKIEDLFEPKFKNLDNGDKITKSSDEKIVLETEEILDEIIEQLQTRNIPFKSPVNNTSNVENTIQC